ncbi:MULTISPECIES: tyrosine-type recombinase/integrase [Lysinibacillus]|uniref:tyrosine-type recombinase/integrase n=1 Tax=Lysinibacillus TaxID=400634 RepID=UPI00257BCB66|nr:MULTISPECIES: site-specific integrase [Lysinibacillus]
MSDIKITPKTPLYIAFEKYRSAKSWSASTNGAYERNIKEFVLDMENNEIDPIIENVKYDYLLEWVKRMEEQFSPKTVNQKISTLSSLYSHFNHLGIINSNPFAAIDAIEDYADEHHSRALNLEELFTVYKAAYELQNNGVNVLIPILIEIYTALRSTSLKKLTVNSVAIQKNGIEFKRNREKGKGNEISKKKEKGNRKNKDFFLPLPPKMMSLLVEHIKDLDPEDSLLYGLKGNPLENKQMNYITNKICEHLNWIEKKNPINNEERVEVIKTEQFFSPHAFRYTISTLFDEMGVPRETIKFLLLHSTKNYDSLDPYLLRFDVHIRRLQAAQILLETVLETALELDIKYNLKLDFQDVSKKLELAFQHQLHNNEEYFLHFKKQIIAKPLSQIMENLQMPIQQTVTPHQMPYGTLQQMVPSQLQPGMVFNQQSQINATSIQMDQLMSILNDLNKGY